MSEVTKSNNTKGNPYHDGETGEFTSAGVEAVKTEVSNNNNSYNDKQKKIFASLGYFPEQEWSKFLATAPIRDINFLIDDFFSVPYFIKNYNGLLKKLLNQNIVVNNNKELDLIGIDLISYDGDLSDLSVENIYDKCNFIDIKTSFNDGINLDAQSLLNPNYKANNLFVCQFMNSDELGGLSRRALANKLIDKNTYEPRDGYEGSSSANIISRKKLYQAIYEAIPHENLEEGYDVLNSLVKSGYRGQELLTRLFNQEEDINIYKDVNGLLRAELPLDQGVTICATCEEFSNNVKMSIRLDKNFITSHFSNSELTYSNIKNSQLVF